MNSPYKWQTNGEKRGDNPRKTGEKCNAIPMFPNPIYHLGFQEVKWWVRYWTPPSPPELDFPVFFHPDLVSPPPPRERGEIRAGCPGSHHRHFAGGRRPSH